MIRMLSLIARRRRAVFARLLRYQNVGLSEIAEKTLKTTIRWKIAENRFSRSWDNLSQRICFLNEGGVHSDDPLKLRDYWRESHQIFTRSSQIMSNELFGASPSSVSTLGTGFLLRPSVGWSACMSLKCIVAKRLSGPGCSLGWWVESVER